MRSKAVLVASVLSAALVTGGWLMERGLQSGDSVFDRARLFDDVMSHVARYYVDTVDQRQLYRKAVDGMLHELHDPYSVFLPAERLKRLTESTTGRYGGIGIQIEPRDGWITVVAALPETPAERAGLATGDRIVEIDGKGTRGWTPDEAQKALRGQPGTSVRIIVERPGVVTTLPMTLTRRQIKVRAVQHALLLRDGVGYLGLTSVFSESMAEEVEEAIDQLRGKGMRELVIDLRGNPGGLLDEGVAVADLFLDPGQRIVSMKGRIQDANREYTDQEKQRWPDLPIVVLIDSGSASASEIVAGALQDHDRAVIVGATSFGKGSAQSLFPMMNGGALKLTTARWYTPVGRSISRPHRSGEDGEEAELADEEESDEPAKREAYRTAGGRTVYGGGGITPDVAASDSTLTPEALAFQRALGKSVPAFRDALVEHAVALKTSRTITGRDFEVTQQMLDELWQRLQRRKIKVERETYDAASPVIARLLGHQIARYVFGPEAEFLRQAREDRSLGTAVELVAGARTQRQLLERAGRAVKRQDANRKS